MGHPHNEAGVAGGAVGPLRGKEAQEEAASPGRCVAQPAPLRLSSEGQPAGPAAGGGRLDGLALPDAPSKGAQLGRRVREGDPWVVPNQNTRNQTKRGDFRVTLAQATEARGLC